MIASASPQQYGQVVEAVLTAGEVDALIVLYIPAGLAETPAVAEAVAAGVKRARAAGAKGKPVLACLMAGQGIQTPLELGSERIPCYAFPEAAARVLAKSAAYADWRSRPAGMIPDFTDIDLSAAREVCRNALAQRGAGWLSAVETGAVLGAVRFPLPPGGFAATAEDAVEVAGRVGFPVAVKLASCQLVHKTEAGGVHLNLTDAVAVRRAFREIRARLAQENRLEVMDGVVVQPMMDGIEVMVGVTQDPLFGPLVAFGLGGVHVEVMADVCFRVTPLTDRDAAEMVRAIRGFRLLQGYRGSAPADLEAIEEVLLRVSRLVEEVPEIGEVDLNPVFALPPGQGCRVADARVQVRTPS
jgi:acyl-CoA synthetase (NDP forming)